MKTTKKEFWKAFICESGDPNNYKTFYVTATNAASAEKKALEIAAIEMSHDRVLYCSSAAYAGNVYL